MPKTPTSTAVQHSRQMQRSHFSVGEDSDAPTLAAKKSALPTRLFQLGKHSDSRFAPVLSSGVVRYLPSNLRRKKIRGIWDRACDRNCKGEIPDFSKKSGI